ncbi:hypothetical protein [Flammeovirga sp. EKP202]|uniref:hypothetical protein n=1 Tax=Flammeovirga sp. EKP202 TaxID=2770592 RepID=UPI00165F04F8|nr:hypothetical protein [Flammeovirga sp. EKP202]MBD0404329.1 hypothetical protein [Flammeovirga sp. EKP202]
MQFKRNHLQSLLGGILLLFSIGLALIDYNSILEPESIQRFIDYSILLFISRWSIYFLLFLAGLTAFFQSKSTNLFLLIFSLTSLLEIYVNENYYIIKSLEDYQISILGILAVIGFLIATINLLKVQRLKLSGIFLSMLLSITLVYLPNALITFYF